MKALLKKVIPGFLYPVLIKAKRSIYNRERFLKDLPKNSIGAEIGVYRGSLTKGILEIVNPRKLHLIDGWWKIYGEFFPWKEKGSSSGPLRTRDAYNDAVGVVEKYDKNKSCIFHVEEDLTCLRQFTDRYFDWVYLDTSHSYEDTVKELEILKDKVKDNGVIAGDDWRPDPNHRHHGVFRAVNEFCKKYGWKVVKIDNCAQWCIEKIKNQQMPRMYPLNFLLRSFFYKIDWLFSFFYRVCSADKSSLTIFLFHGIFEDEKEAGLNNVLPISWVTKDYFRSFIEYYSGRGYSFVSPKDILDGLDNSKKYIMITFDDGYFNNSRVLPILREYRLPACFCFSTSNLKYNKSFWWDVLYRERIKNGTKIEYILREIAFLKLKKHEEIEEYLVNQFGENSLRPVGDADRPFTVDELAAFSREELVFLGNHAMDHAVLENYSSEEIKTQILGAQKDIQEITGTSPVLIAYPDGYYAKRIIKIAQDCGFRLGVTTRPWKNYLPLGRGKKLLTLGRCSGAKWKIYG